MKLDCFPDFMQKINTYCIYFVQTVVGANVECKKCSSKILLNEDRVQIFDLFSMIIK